MKNVLKKFITLTLVSGFIVALSGCAYDFDQQYQQKQLNNKQTQNQQNQQTMAANNLENAPAPPNLAS